MDAKLRSVLLFDVDADTPHRVLTEATDAGVAAAREALGTPVDTNGALGSARDGKKRVRVELAMRAPPAAVMQAEKAFAAAFAATLAKKGHAVEQL
ncbi:MAG TPA: hypothetical protein VFH78_09555 [Candidatus Thermoplasmatota archaeon]|nr:hypothetical protein [Candidatus Thermoplasmatota archaeon]